MLNITRKTEDGQDIFSLEGRLDTVTAPALEQQLISSLDQIQTLVLDFENLEYISSAGLRVLLWAHKSMRTRGEMKVIHINSIIREVFDVTGFSEILNIE